MSQHVDFKKREEFRIRLVRSLEKAGFNPRKAGELCTAFNKRYSSGQVTSISVYKWLMGESMPTEDKLHILASMCEVCPHWLRYGEHIKPIETGVMEFNNAQQC
jgi:hypothetical protein